MPEVLGAHGLSPESVAALIRGPSEKGLTLFAPGGKRAANRYLAQIIHSPMDADQIDYLMRDAHYTGAAHGMLVARGLMYSSVYFHKTVRIAEQMLARAVERSEAPMAQIQKMVDHELLSWLTRQSDFHREIALRLKYRKLYKRAASYGADELSESAKQPLAAFADADARRRAEDRIALRANLKAGQVIVDVPLPELLLSEPRIAKTEVTILDDGQATRFSRASPLGRALQTRPVVDWVVMVACPPEAVAAVRKAAASLLG